MVVDIIAGIILLASIIISILRGFVREVLTIFGILGGVIAAYIGGPLLSPIIKGWLGVSEGEGEAEPQKLFDIIPYPMLADFLAYAVIFIIFVIILSIISHFLAASVRNIGLGAVDRTLGMVFGLVRGVLLLGLLYLPVYYLVDGEQSEEYGWLKNSKSRVYLEATSGWIVGLIPADSMDNIAEATKEIGEMNEARKKLQEMNVLTPMPVPAPEDEPQKTPAKGDADPEGYSDDFRNKMDQLIERTTEE
jgi:membrane protein required for colicin V production